MAIDMIENNELGALSHSRLGNKCFIDDNNYSNFSITSKKEKARRKAESIAQVEATWGIDPSKANDCDYLQSRLKMLSDEIQNQLSKNPSSVTMDRLVNPLKDVETRYKNAITKNKCVEKQSQLESDVARKQTIEAINEASSSAPNLNVATQGSKTTKYLMYGIGGVVVLITLVIVIKALKKQ
jgi:hypothetical protein